MSSGYKSDELLLTELHRNLSDTKQKYMKDSERKLEPWIAVDPGLKREWVLPNGLQYYVVEDRSTGKWFICDRWTDSAVPNTKAPTRPEAIRLFYKWCNREMPEGTVIGRASTDIAHHGETG